MFPLSARNSTYTDARSHLANFAPPRIRAFSSVPAPPPAYDRTRDLPRLLPLWPHEVVVTSPESQAALMCRLRRALRMERRRGIAGHWTYNLARHADLLRAYRAEQALAADAARQMSETAGPQGG
jgi:hypothetical protein